MVRTSPEGSRAGSSGVGRRAAAKSEPRRRGVPESSLMRRSLGSPPFAGSEPRAWLGSATNGSFCTAGASSRLPARQLSFIFGAQPKRGLTTAPSISGAGVLPTQYKRGSKFSTRPSPGSSLIASAGSTELGTTSAGSRQITGFFGFCLPAGLPFAASGAVISSVSRRASKSTRAASVPRFTTAKAHGSSEPSSTISKRRPSGAAPAASPVFASSAWATAGSTSGGASSSAAAGAASGAASAAASRASLPLGALTGPASSSTVAPATARLPPAQPTAKTAASAANQQPKPSDRLAARMRAA